MATWGDNLPFFTYGLLTVGKLLVIKVLAAGINPVDYKLPSIPVAGRFVQGKGAGLDVCGEVVYAPPGCNFKLGDVVFGIAKSGSLAEYAECEPGKVAVKPESLTAVQAALLPTAGLTALQALRDHGGVKSGDSVLVIGGSGGCGAIGVSIAKAMGASVTAICSQKNKAFVYSLGADVVSTYVLHALHAQYYLHYVPCDLYVIGKGPWPCST